MKKFAEIIKEAKRDNNASDKYKKFFLDKGFKISFSGFLDESENKFKITDAITWAKKEGYRLAKKPFMAFDFKNYVFEKTPGPYQNEILSFDTKNDKFVRHVRNTIIVDKS